jgi:hypothetical protein
MSDTIEDAIEMRREAKELENWAGYVATDAERMFLIELALLRRNEAAEILGRLVAERGADE